MMCSLFLDIDECLASPCHSNATCSDIDGSYLCQCEVGYTGDGWTCGDIDECATNPCDVNAYCNNTEASYICTCDAGYTGNGWNCSSKYPFMRFYVGTGCSK